MKTPESPTGAAQHGLGKRAARGAAVTIAGQGGRILLQVVSVVVLARLLSPHDYGLVAMVLAIIGIGEVFRDFGLSSAAVQAPTLSRGQRDNLFWINTGLGVALAGLVFLFAPLIAALYGEPELELLARVLAVTFVLNGLTTQYRADRNRNLRFTVLAVSDIVAALVGLGVALVTAIAGWGYWALAAQQLAQGIIGLIILASSARWIPHLPDRTAPMRPLLSFGGNLVASQLIGYITNNVDSVIIGVRLGAAPLGIYNRGFQLLMQPLGQLRAPTTSVALPVLSRLSADPTRYGAFVIRGQQALGYTLVAGLSVAIAAAEPLTALLLGSQWSDVPPILRLLAIAGIFQTLAYVGYWVYLSRGLTGDLLRYTMVTSVLRITCILVGSTWGLVGVAAGYAIGPALAWPISLFWLSRRTELPLRALVTGACRMLTVAAISSALGWLCSWQLAHAGSVVQLAATVGVVVVVYALAGLIVRPVRRDLTAVIDIARMLPAARRSRGDGRADG
ncbi:MAG: lipopolysaccharide biosynthesis protein [Mycetocola sp.]